MLIYLILQILSMVKIKENLFYWHISKNNKCNFSGKQKGKLKKMIVWFIFFYYLHFIALLCDMLYIKVDNSPHILNHKNHKNYFLLRAESEEIADTLIAAARAGGSRSSPSTPSSETFPERRQEEAEVEAGAKSVETAGLILPPPPHYSPQHKGGCFPLPCLHLIN